MGSDALSRKRKVVTRDAPVLEEPALVDELGNRPLDSAFSDSEEDHSDDAFDSDDKDGEDEEEKLDSDEVPSEAGSGGLPKTNGVLRSDLEDAEHNYTITQDANGNPRYVYREIDPVYDSDDSDAPIATNTIGNIPLSFYDAYPHIGYDVDGRRVMRPAKGAALDSLLESIDVPKDWTGLIDPNTGKPLKLSDEELDVLKRLTRNEKPVDDYDEYPDTIEYFTRDIEAMPLNAAPEPKRRFVPSKHEATRVMKIVKAIREGRIQPYKPPQDEEADDEQVRYDLWADEAPRPDHVMNIPAPKLPPPGYEESYHPPPEYLPDATEKKAWQETDEEDKEKEYLPTNYDALRKVPGYEKFIKEKFERCLDLYLAPRIRRSKLNIDPESLLPKLPNPEELRPFPSHCKLIYKGGKGRVRSLAISPDSGKYLATGGDDGMVRVYQLETGQQMWNLKLSSQEAVNAVRWRPRKDCLVLSAAAGESVYLINPGFLDADGSSGSQELADTILNAGWALSNGISIQPGKEAPAKWVYPDPRLQEQGVMVQINLRSAVKVISWHRHGEYFSTVSPQAQSQAIAIHTLSKHQTQIPIRKLKALAQSVAFHPSKPIFFVATQRMIRVYDLAKQESLKVLQPGARWISSFDVHPGGDNLVVGSFDKRLLWMDLELSTRPYKTLRYHTKAIRSVKYHQGGWPLFADASDDGSLQIFHGKVHADMMENASIVPLKVLQGHQVTNGLGVLDLDWHPYEPWIVSAGADGTCRLWAS